MSEQRGKILYQLTNNNFAVVQLQNNIVPGMTATDMRRILKYLLLQHESKGADKGQLVNLRNSFVEEWDDCTFAELKKATGW